MKIDTKYSGEVEVTEENIVDFKTGLPGFEDRKRFVVLDLEGNDVFKILQDIERPELAFILVNPWDFFEDYEIELDLGEEKDQVKDLRVFTIVTLEEELKDSTTNLLAPLVLNCEKNQGRQIILNGFPYTTKHKLFLEEES